MRVHSYKAVFVPRSVLMSLYCSLDKRASFSLTLTFPSPLSFISSPLLSYPPHSLRPLLLVLLLLGALLGRVLLHTLRDGLVVFGDVVEEPLQALLDGLVHLFAVAKDGRARLLRREIRRYDVMTGSEPALCLYLVKPNGLNVTRQVHRHLRSDRGTCSR